MWEIIRQIFPYAIAFTIPLLITALGGLFSERSGIVNIGLEGLMVIGFFASAAVIIQFQESNATIALLLGLLAGFIAGGIFAILHAFASISLNADQVISGTAINMMAGALTLFLARTLTGSGNIAIRMGLPRFDVPWLTQIPVIGPLLFRQTYFTTWLVLFILLISWILLYKTSFGLRLRACGEHPYAAASAGINVYRMRYIAVIISGMLAGLGGATILVTYSGEFTGSVAGLGFLALASLIFGQWKPLGILGATFFFGFASTVANVSQVIPELAAIPPVILKIFPYVVTLIALVLFSKSSQAPKAVGVHFDLGKK
ncbi:MAG: ABC transporter permease [Clostridia bacterium]